MSSPSSSTQDIFMCVALFHVMLILCLVRFIVDLEQLLSFFVIRRSGSCAAAIEMVAAFMLLSLSAALENSVATAWTRRTVVPWSTPRFPWLVVPAAGVHV